MVEQGDMKLDRFKEILAAYGGDSSRWPEDERAAAEQLATTSDEAKELLACAGELDVLLSSTPTPAPASVAFLDKLASQPAPTVANQAVGTARTSGFAFGALFQILRAGGMMPRAAGLISACALGIVLGTSQLGRHHDNYLVVDASENLITNAGLMSDLKEID